MKQVFSMLCILAAAVPTAAQAHGSIEVVGVDAEPVIDDELAQQRGGFTWSGMEISFGANMRSYVGDDLALQTIISWTSQGATVERYVSPSLSPVDAAQIQAGILSGARISMNIGADTAYLANQGQTIFIHRSDGALQNILVNTANGVNLTQQVDATLDISGYDGFRSELATNRMGETLVNATGTATIGSLGF